MVVRIIVGALLLPVAVIIILFGDLLLQSTLFLLAVWATNELYRAFHLPFSKRQLLTYLGIGIYYFGVLPEMQIAQTGHAFLIFMILWFVMHLSQLAIHYGKASLNQLLLQMLLPLYPALLLSTVFLALDVAPELAWVMFLTAWGYDTCAYFTGKFLGKTKITPVLSPNKTLAGFVGGVIGAMAIVLIYLLTLTQIEQVILVTFAAGIIAIGGQLGDLVASAIKREQGIKDFSELIPGHGGIMDRFDSLMFTAPLTYVLILFILGR